MLILVEGPFYIAETNVLKGDYNVLTFKKGHFKYSATSLLMLQNDVG